MSANLEGTVREGSVFFDDVAPLLRQQEQLYNFLTTSLNIAEIGIGLRFGPQWVHLVGERINPYEFSATPKDGAAGNLLLTIIAEATFFDSSGNEIPEDDNEIQEKAVRFTETLTHVEIRQAG